MTRDAHTHVQAMSPQEAAMLPAVAPGHITMPLNESHFVPAIIPAENAEKRRGSAAGRAILRQAGVSLPGVFPMGCARRRIRMERDCDM